MARAFSATELADETGLSTEQIEWLARLGLLRPRTAGMFVQGDVFRGKMIGALLGAGFTREQVETAVSRAGVRLDHVDRYVIREVAERSPRAFRAFSAEVGDLGRLLPGIYQMLGLPEPDPSTHLPVDEEQMLREFLDVWGRAEDPETAFRAARLAGDGIRTAALGWPELLYEQIAGPARERWLRQEVEHFPSEAVDASTRSMRLLPELASWLIQRYFEQAITSGIAESFEEVLAARGLAPEPEPPHPPAVVFVDISGYTRLTEEHGDETAARVATALQKRSQQVAARRGGRLVKLLGDGAMLSFRDPGEGVEAAIELVTTLGDELALPAHAGVHAGRVIERDRDLFGGTVNLASRIAGVAGPGRVLVTDAVVRVAGIDPGRLEAVEPEHLKGIAEPVPLYAVAAA